MANETLKELKYDGKKTLTEAAKRDGSGRIFENTYLEIAKSSFPKIQIVQTRKAEATGFTVTSSTFFNSTISNYIAFDANIFTLILDRPVLENGYFIALFQEKNRLRRAVKDNKYKVRGYQYAHLKDPLSTINSTIFWQTTIQEVVSNSTIPTEVKNSFKTEWNISANSMCIKPTGRIAVLMKKPHITATTSSLGYALRAYDTTNVYKPAETRGFQKMAFAVCKYDPSINPDRVLIGPMTYFKVSYVNKAGISYVKISKN